MSRSHCNLELLGKNALLSPFQMMSPNDAIKSDCLSTFIGKEIAGDRYIHVSALSRLSEELTRVIRRATELTGLESERDFNVIKLNQSNLSISLLSYADFFENPFPALQYSWRVNLEAGTFEKRSYASSLNPPILHRKELLLAPDHPDIPRFRFLTESAEKLGLFQATTKIGYRSHWEGLISERGYVLNGHSLEPVQSTANHQTLQNTSSERVVMRQLTALTRYGYSAPVQVLARFGFLDGSRTVFDYGCGKGDDVRGLKENGVTASGWDPFYAKENARTSAQVVNLGFVINVIEDLDERTEALRQAYGLATQVLVVSAMLRSQDNLPGKPYRDGVMTQRNTFQKYYSQTELRIFIQQTLLEDAIPVAPGTFFVFRNKDEEQRFMFNRSRARGNILRAASIAERAPIITREDKLAARFEEKRSILEPLWQQWLELGREPDKTEAEHILELVEAFGTYPKALRFLQSYESPGVIESSRKSKRDDLEVYFALRLFEKKKPYSHLEETLQRDIRYFFGDYTHALESAKQLLFQIANADTIERACQQAFESGLGYLIPRESLQLHTSLVERLPPLLRVYIGCGTTLFGDVTSADLVKIHIKSSKLTLMRFDDFAGIPLPKMIQRVKINLRTQELDVFQYGEMYSPPFLYMKSRYINEEFPLYPDQLKFDEALDSLKLFDFSEHGPREQDLLNGLKKARWEIKDFALVRMNVLPSLDEMCGVHLTFRDLVECGQTQSRTGLPNLPKKFESYDALQCLAIHILDPIIDYYGSIKLFYGFSSRELTKEIALKHAPKIAPALDQHAAHELNSKGKLICDRLGASCDFIIEDEDMEEVMNWIRETLPFDRMYFYGKESPIHVSYGPDNKREVIEMKENEQGKSIPRKI